MKKDTLHKLREKDEAELIKDLQADKDKLWQLRADLVSGKIQNVSEIRKLKRNVAVINTVLREKALNK